MAVGSERLALCHCHVISEFHIISGLAPGGGRKGPASHGSGPPGIVAVLVAVHVLQTIAQGPALCER